MSITNGARFNLTWTLIKRALNMPEDTVLVKINAEPWCDSVELFVLHPDLPAVSEGIPFYWVAPSVTKNDDGSFTWHWNVDKHD